MTQSVGGFPVMTQSVGGLSVVVVQHIMYTHTPQHVCMHVVVVVVVGGSLCFGSCVTARVETNNDIMRTLAHNQEVKW